MLSLSLSLFLCLNDVFRDLLAILVETIPNVLFSSRLFPDWISILAGVSVDLAARVCFSLCAHVVVSLCFVYMCVWGQSGT